MTSMTACPGCAGRRLDDIYTVTDVPVQSCILLDTRDAALDFPRHDIVLRFCVDCGLIFNAACDPALVDYAAMTEESQHFSGTFNTFANGLVDEIAARRDLRGKHVLEIGCGKGEFLQQLCARTGCIALGIDPGFLPERLAADGGGALTFRREYFDPARIAEPPDLVICRHTLEHIPAVGAFVAAVHALVAGRPDATVFFETPDALRILREGAFWDIYYEHCNYFTPGSHARLFRNFGFVVAGLRLDYQGQYIIQYAGASDMPASGPVHDAEETVADLRRLVADFPDTVARTRTAWTEFVTARHAAGKRLALWGGGSKAVSFLTTLGLNSEISQVVDINRFKQGKYLPATGHRVIGPQDLAAEPPDTVIVMNPVYVPEISAQLGELGLQPEVTAL